MRTKAKPHQVPFLSWAGTGRTAFPIFSDPGTGKTWCVIALMEKYGWKRCLIFTEEVHVDTWVQEVHDNSSWLKAVPLAGPYAKRKKALQDPDVQVFVTTYHMLSSRAGANLLMLYPWDFIGADESTNIKNWNSGRTKAIIRLGDGTRYKALITGTPATNHALEDLWSQFRFMDGGATFGRSFWDFRRRYFYQAGFDWKLKTGAAAAIHRILNAVQFRVRKDVLKLPPRALYRMPVPMSEAQQVLYKQIVNDWCVTLGTGRTVNLDFVIQKTTKLCQLCSGILRDGDHTERVPTLKPLYLKQLLAKQVMPKHKAVLIWCRYTAEVVDIERICASLGLRSVVIAGSVKAFSVVQQFQKDLSVDVCILTLSKGARALTLTRASAAVYYGRNFSSDHRIQSMDRNHRIGSEHHAGRTIEYFDLYIRGSVEETMIKRILTYRQLATLLLDGPNAAREVFLPVSKV